MQNAAKAASSVYRRPLNAKFIPLTTPIGKKLFKDALTDGYMEAYFHLSDQFVTQIEPFTCGPSSLVMVLNALEIDPRTTWKGIWRWFSEDNLNHLPSKDQPLTLSMYSELALANYCSVQMLFHKDIETLSNWSFKREKCHFHIDNISCKLPEFPVDPKSCSFLTFKHSVLALSRVSGCYLIMNYDRRAYNRLYARVDQTGSGHFSPITGYHRQEDKSLVLDVARFKYPSHWMDLWTLYQSMKTIDEQSGLTRGFIIACRSTELFADICRITPDYPLIKEITDHFEAPEVKDQFKALLELKDGTRVHSFLELVKTVNPKMIDLLTLLIIQFTYSLETKRNNAGEELALLLGRIAELHQEFERTDFSEKDFDNHPLLSVSRDYLPKGYKSLLALIFELFKIQIVPSTTHHESAKALQYWQNYLFI